MANDQFTVETAQDFHRRMAAIIDAVQARIWQAGVRSPIGYATDYAFGQERGLQTLVLKTRNPSTYVRLRRRRNPIIDVVAGNRKQIKGEDDDHDNHDDL